MTRTVAIGYADDRMHRVYDTVLRAQQAGLAAIRAGIPCREVDAAARRVIEEEAGYRRLLRSFSRTFSRIGDS